MKEVAASFNMTTSTVSQQIAALAKDAGTQLIEPEGRRVRLTPAGRRLPSMPSLSWQRLTQRDWTSIPKPIPSASYG